MTNETSPAVAQPVTPPSDPPLRGLRKWAVIAEVVAAAAVVISLLFVGFQLAQANKLERNAAMQRQIEAVTMLSRQVIDTPGLSKSFGRANRGETLTQDEKVMLDAFLTYADRTWEGLYLQYLDGQVDKDLWEAHRTQALPVNNSAVSRAVWKARKDWYTPKYRAFREAELAAGTGETMSYDYFKAIEKPQPATPAATEPPKQ